MVNNQQRWVVYWINSGGHWFVLELHLFVTSLHLLLVCWFKWLKHFQFFLYTYFWPVQPEIVFFSLHRQSNQSSNINIVSRIMFSWINKLIQTRVLQHHSVDLKWTEAAPLLYLQPWCALFPVIVCLYLLGLSLFCPALTQLHLPTATHNSFPLKCPPVLLRGCSRGAGGKLFERRPLPAEVPLAWKRLSLWMEASLTRLIGGLPLS